MARQLQNFFRRFPLISDRDPLKTEPQPAKDWLRLIILTFFALVLVFLGYVYLVQRAGKLEEDARQENRSLAPKEFSRQKLDQLVSEIDQRAAAYNFYLSNKPTTTDPTL